jgi:hypothetical protein
MADISINLTVVGDRSCSTTLTYLSYLRDAGLRPKRLWLVDFGPVGRVVRAAGSLIGHHLVARLLRTNRVAAASAEYESLCWRLQHEAGLAPINYFETWEAKEFAETVEYLRAVDYLDPILQSRICDDGCAFLYTNGGIVPAALLSRPGVRVLHIHPGIVPDVRGSDCLLWSAHVRKQIGVSCFYMSPGIDEGAVIGQREFKLPKLPSLAPLLTASGEAEATRALLYAVDPHFRAKLLVDVIRSNSAVDLRALPVRPQPPAGRPAYLWMHPRLRRKVMQEAFL